jgi:hypothetical protein
MEGTLEGDRLASIESHLAGCDLCLRLVAEAGRSLRSNDEADDAPTSDVPPLVAGVEVGRYVILEPVGAGGMGRVYAARDPALDRKVALKLLHRHATAPELEARLLREAKAMARLAHPEVITVHDVGHFGDQLFIAMEFVEGGTLRQWLAAAKRPWREVLGVFLRAGRGLARAHASGIVHRDFKPDNVLVGTDGRVRVTDFGLALTAQDEPGVLATSDSAEPDVGAALTRTGMLVGTPAYMAPEQMSGQPADARSDLYGFCTALWEALYGKRPYTGETLKDLKLEKMRGSPENGPAGRDVAPRLRRALQVGLRPHPEDRYASMDELLGALERAGRTSIVPRIAGACALLALAGGAAYAATIARYPVGISHVASPSTGCAGNAACALTHGGEPWVCRSSDHTCVALASEDCAPLFEPGDLRADDTVWLGALFPAKGPSAEAFGTMNLRAANLARTETASMTSALSGSTASVHVRPIALLGCDDSVDPMRAAAHLVDDVGVPAILGFSSGKEVIDVAGSFLIQRRVLTMATLTQSSAIARLPQPSDLPRMVWRTTNNYDAVAVATAHFVHDVLEPRAAAKPTRVALVRDEAATSLQSFAETFNRTLVINGRPAVENDTNYVEIALPTEDKARAAEARLVRVAPAVVVIAAERSRAARLVDGVERGWPAGVRRPVYVIELQSSDVLHDFIGTSAERRHRVLSLSPVAVPIATSRFLMRLEAAYPGGGATQMVNPGTTYDGFYALAFAIFAQPAEAVTGPGLARGLARLASPGHRVESGPTDLFSGIAALTRGESIDLDGPSGELDFDPATGELQDDFSLLCPGVDAAGQTSGDVESGVVYVASERRTTGVLRCP